MNLYENIKELRLRNEWSQEELAKRAGYTDRSSIAKIEQGEVDLKYSKILTFAYVFGVDPVDLMGLSDRTEIVKKINDEVSAMSEEDQRSTLAYAQFVRSKP